MHYIGQLILGCATFWAIFSETHLVTLFNTPKLLLFALTLACRASQRDPHPSCCAASETVGRKLCATSRNYVLKPGLPDFSWIQNTKTGKKYQIATNYTKYNKRP
jgi:hypothetical protein